MATSSDKKGAAQAAPTLDELAQQIWELIEKGDENALGHALEVGALLIQAKAKVPHGHWEEWVRKSLKISRNTSARYMRLAANVTSSIHFKSIEEADRAIRQPRKSKPALEPKRKPREAGKRLRALHAQKREKDSNLLIARVDIVKMVGILEAVDLPGLGFGDAEDETVEEIHAELSILFNWLDRSLTVATARLSDQQRVEKIRKLREAIEGRTPEEIATANRLADKLERKALQAV
jgi:Protein of unknown function (DUF3102)